jgi:hypothetical protein
MAGLLTHVTIALVGFLIGTFAFKNYRYGLAFAIGSLIPDLTDFGLAGIRQGSFNPSVIMTNPAFHPLAVFSHSALTWVLMGLLFILLMGILYKYDKIKRKNFITGWVCVIFFIVGVAVHLIIDQLIIETSYWI